MSVTADAAHLAERIKDVQPSSGLIFAGEPISPLKPGVCYVLGDWGGPKLSFARGGDVALT